MSARNLTQGAAAGRRVSLRPESLLAQGTCERSYPFTDGQPMTWSHKHNRITGAPAGTTESPPTG